ncbi:DNA-binding SARP family transcriptional activator [Actinoplanes lutulentus]|nr:DNA-binding SARP family transcriptional activator [Actinoplanes lutulentus]
MFASLTEISTGTDNLRIQMLGPLRLWRDGEELDIGPRQQAHVLALLLAHAGQPVSKSELIDLVWGDEAPASALNILHKYIGNLRRLLEPALEPRRDGSYLRRRGHGYLITVGPDELDLDRFRTLVRAAAGKRATGRLQAALDDYAGALHLWHGSTAQSLTPDSPAIPVATSLDHEFFDACGAAADLAITLRRPKRILPALRLAAWMAPLHESMQASLITALAADGRQAEALASFHEVSARLVEELGIDPGWALRQAHRQILAAMAGPGAVAAPARPAQLPPLLPAFAGRAGELAALTELLATPRTSTLVVALDGVAGAGTSALASQFAHEVAAQFPDGQLYLDLRGHVAGARSLPAEAALHTLLRSLGVPMSGMPDTVDTMIGTYRSLTAGRRILVLLDNAQDAAQVRALLPNSAHCLVLVTSRTPLVGLAALDGARLLHVDLPGAPSAREPHRPAVGSARQPGHEPLDTAGEQMSLTLQRQGVRTPGGSPDRRDGRAPRLHQPCPQQQDQALGVPLAVSLEQVLGTVEGRGGLLHLPGRQPHLAEQRVPGGHTGSGRLQQVRRDDLLSLGDGRGRVRPGERQRPAAGQPLIGAQEDEREVRVGRDAGLGGP